MLKETTTVSFHILVNFSFANIWPVDPVWIIQLTSVVKWPQPNTTEKKVKSVMGITHLLLKFRSLPFAFGANKGKVWSSTNSFKLTPFSRPLTPPLTFGATNSSGTQIQTLHDVLWCHAFILARPIHCICVAYFKMWFYNTQERRCLMEVLCNTKAQHEHSGILKCVRS